MLNSRHAIAAALAAGVLAATSFSAPAEAQERVKIGGLRCAVSGGLGMVIASSRTMHCTFSSTAGYRESYMGTIRKYGLDIGSTGRGTLAWAVFAPTSGPRRGALAGDYGGVAASASVGAGLGANLLVGGFDRSITLQPLSLETKTGLNLAAGVASLTLEAAR